MSSLFAIFVHEAFYPRGGMADLLMTVEADSVDAAVAAMIDRLERPKETVEYSDGSVDHEFTGADGYSIGRIDTVARTFTTVAQGRLEGASYSFADEPRRTVKAVPSVVRPDPA